MVPNGQNVPQDEKKKKSRLVFSFIITLGMANVGGFFFVTVVVFNHHRCGKINVSLQMIDERK